MQGKRTLKKEESHQYTQKGLGNIPKRDLAIYPKGTWQYTQQVHTGNAPVLSVNKYRRAAFTLMS